MSQIKAILRKATRKQNEPLNILSFCTHEAYETNLANTTEHNFYAIRRNDLKDWNPKYRNVPDNYILLDKDYGEYGIPSWVDFDLVLSQNKFAHFQLAQQIAAFLNIPLVTLEHCLPQTELSPMQLLEIRDKFNGQYNVFISEYSRDKWMCNLPNTTVIRHMIEDDVFKPNPNIERQNYILSVVNLWKDRDYFCNYYGWERTTQGLPVRVVGDNPGLSLPANTLDDLITEYQTAKIFYNTSTISPIPSSLIEAAACGCAIVSTNTCLIPETFEHGKNAFLSNDENELRGYLELLLNDDELAYKMGQAARENVQEVFNKDRYKQQWNDLFWKAVQ